MISTIRGATETGGCVLSGIEPHEDRSEWQFVALVVEWSRGSWFGFRFGFLTHGRHINTPCWARYSTWSSTLNCLESTVIRGSC